MKIKEEMVVKIIRIMDHEYESIDEGLLKYIGKIGIVDGVSFDYFNVFFNNEHDCSFYEDEVKIIYFKEQTNMFRNNCLWCRSKNKKFTIDNKNFNFTMFYCPKCLR